MALTSCTECGAQISTDAAACPKCGARRRASHRKLWLLPLGAMAAMAVILFSGYQVNEARAEKNKQACAAAIQEAVGRSSSVDEVNAIARADPRVREACADFDMNGVPVVQ